ncbi:hypothetical protein E4U45_002205 [Claviceps purpurea]|nr:hypothetical protein E4U45_002205 [Claviceps purpurea]
MCQRRDGFAAGSLTSSQPEYKDQITEAKMSAKTLLDELDERHGRHEPDDLGELSGRDGLDGKDSLDSSSSSWNSINSTASRHPQPEDPDMREHTRLASASLMNVALGQAAST